MGPIVTAFGNRQSAPLKHADLNWNWSLGGLEVFDRFGAADGCRVSPGSGSRLSASATAETGVGSATAATGCRGPGSSQRERTGVCVPATADRGVGSGRTADRSGVPPAADRCRGSGARQTGVDAGVGCVGSAHGGQMSGLPPRRDRLPGSGFAAHGAGQVWVLGCRLAVGRVSARADEGLGSCAGGAGGWVGGYF